jgi:4-amino-4-deoxy-L-arabinose transferase-like glycosyltransferase
MIEASGDDRSRLRFALALVAIAIVALAIRVVFVVVVDPSVPKIGDASAYHLLGEHIARGDGYIRPFDEMLLHRTRATAEYPPLFPALLAVPARVGLHSVQSQRLFMALVGTGTVVLIGLLGRRVGGPAVGLIAAALAACSPMLFQSEGILMAEGLYVPLVVVTLLLTYRAYDDPSAGRFIALGIAIGLATLTRAEGALHGLLLVGGLCLRTHGLAPRQRLVRGAAALAVALCVLAPWTIRNAARFHAFVPVSNNAATLVDGANCDSTYGGVLLGLWRETFSQFGDKARQLPQAQACFEGFDIADPHFDETKVASKHRRDGVRYALHHLGSLPKVTAVRMLRTWGVYAPRQQVNFESLEGRPREWQMRGTVMHWVLLPLAIAGVVLCRRRRAVIWPLVTTALAVSVVSALTYGQQRFRVGAEPALIVLAAVTVAAIGRRLRRPFDDVPDTIPR